MSFQLFAKSGTDLDVFLAYPDFNKQDTFWSVQNKIISSELSPCGRFLAISDELSVLIYFNEKLLAKWQLKDVYDLKFSPSGNYLMTWERPSINCNDYNNVKVWYLNENNVSDEPCYSYKSKTQSNWHLQFSQLDTYALKKVGNQLRIVKLNDSDHKTNFDFNDSFSRLEVEQHVSIFSVSSSLDNPTVAVFVPEKSGKPASISIYPITQGIINKTIVTKTFFKADSCQLKWNSKGDSILCLTTTDFDSSNKSYYGENNLYLLSFKGFNGSLSTNSIRVPLNKEGPIHDFNWCPDSKQFGVIYGFMPATITFFDLKANVVYSLNDQAKNTLIYSPKGNYVLIGGFGNLQGSVEILNREKNFITKSKFNATNTSICKWSPGNEFILTATTSPRLRVDNGLKIWHVSGNLCFVKEYKELLKIDWKSPCEFKLNEHMINYHRKLLDTPNDPIILNSKDLKIHPNVNEYKSKRSNSIIGSNGNKSTGAYKPPHARRANNNLIPGMAQREIKQKKNDNTKPENRTISTSKPTQNSSSSPVSPEDKKIRSLLKKLRAIETLKQRQLQGEKLEDTQLLKIKIENTVLSDLQKLGWKKE